MVQISVSTRLDILFCFERVKQVMGEAENFPSLFCILLK